jgi:type III restriction enzyme
MKLKFDANQPFQKAAINSVVDLFDGQPFGDTDYSTVVQTINTQLFGAIQQNELGIGNNLLLDKKLLLNNLQRVQEQNTLDISSELLSWDWSDDATPRSCPNFSVEMETGTGKTYVYLRTACELSRKYGFKKFIIVVPSIAIREGVLKTLQITKEHFRALFNQIEIEHSVYDSKRVNQLRQFATSNNLQILVINIDAFRKNFMGTELEQRSNVIYRENDKLSGRPPIDYIRATRPIVIIDEPQSVDNTDRAQQAILALNPLCTLRYSATHRNPYNLIYRLDPIQAYELRLVKQIVVASVTADDSHNEAYVKLCSVDNKNGIKGEVEIDVALKSGVKKKRVPIKLGDDLHLKSNERSAYETGYQIIEINAEPGRECIVLSGGMVVPLSQEIGGIKHDLWKEQIRRTVVRHLEKELELNARGIKVLSLFFVDRVANYRSYDDNGQAVPGKFALVLEEVYKELIAQPRFESLNKHPVSELHDGYFAQDKKGALRDTKGDTQADDDVYNLIMKEKERLLSMEEPLCFIFSHSALKEGWDNPNVFQICTLNETSSTNKKRQEIGRGLRLPVNQDGVRIFDEQINRLLVIANESYEDFARALQTEYEDDCGVTFGKVPKLAFSTLERLVAGEPSKLGGDKSAELWKALKTNGYIDDQGRIQPSFTPNKPDFELRLPDEFIDLKQAVVDVLCAYQIERHVKRDENPKRITFKKAVALDPEFLALWDKIKARTSYAVNYSTDELVREAVKAIKAMPRIEPVRIHYAEAGLGIANRGISTTVYREGDENVVYRGAVPDVLSYLQGETELTRATLVRILTESGRISEVIVNPQEFMDSVAAILKRELNRLIIDGIKYERVVNEEYEMRLFETEELVGYLHNRLEVKHSIYDAIVYDSDTERKFAEQLDNREDIKLFVKLPRWFKIDTPIGNYNPDWAIVKEDSSILYLIRETKGTKDFEKLRNTEAEKVFCGRRHFESLGVDFAVVTNANEI